MSSKSKKHSRSSKDASSSSSKSSKKSSKSSSSKNSKEILAASSAVMKLVTAKPKHYTSRRVVTKLAEKFSSDVIRAAIASLQGTEKLDFDRKDGGKGKKGQFVMIPLSRKAA